MLPFHIVWYHEAIVKSIGKLSAAILSGNFSGGFIIVVKCGPCGPRYRPPPSASLSCGAGAMAGAAALGSRANTSWTVVLPESYIRCVSVIIAHIYLVGKSGYDFCY